MTSEQALRELAESWRISANEFSKDPVEKRVLLHCAEKVLLILKEGQTREAFTRAVLRYMDVKDFKSASELTMCLVTGDMDKAKSLIEAI